MSTKRKLVEFPGDFKDRRLLASRKPINFGMADLNEAGFVKGTSESGKRINCPTRVKGITMYSRHSGKPLRVFKSAAYAADATGTCATSITKAARGEQKTAGGYVWKWGPEPKEESKNETDK